MSNYKAKVRIRWIPTKCTNPKCGNEDEAVDFILQDGRSPKCSECGSPMTYDKGDQDNDPA